MQSTTPWCLNDGSMSSSTDYQNGAFHMRTNLRSDPPQLIMWLDSNLEIDGLRLRRSGCAY
jgi:hypothetical protein